MSQLQVFSFPPSGRAATVSLSLLLLFSPLLPAQNQPPPVSSGGGVPAASKSTTGSSAASALKANANEVSFDLAVRTKHNKPVIDLQPSQLAVTDGGQAVQLSSLHLVDNSSGSQHLAVFVFDRLDRGVTKTARKMAANLIGAIPAHGYSIAVLQVDGRLRLLQPFTDDRSLIEAAANKAVSASLQPRLTSLTPAEKSLIATVHGDALVAERAQDKLLLTAMEQSQQILEDRRSYPSLAALQALVESDRLLTGRKFIFYFSAGIDANSDVRDILKSIVAQANRAGVTIWVLDTTRMNEGMNSAQQASLASSILGMGPAGGSTSAFGGGGGVGAIGGGYGAVEATDIAGYAFGNLAGDQSPLAALAFGTGGTYIGPSGGYKHQLQRLRENLSSWYEVSWTPPLENYDGQFRPVVIHSLRKNVVIRARSGYFAVPLNEKTGVRPFEVPLLKVLAGTTLPADVTFHAGIMHLGALADGNSSELIVQAPVSQLEMREDATTHISSADAVIVAVIKDSKGAVLANYGEEFPLHEAPGTSQSGGAITLEEHFSADPGVYTLESAVMDRLANKVGAQRTTFKVEPPQQGLALSDIALVKRVEPNENANQAFDPMFYGDNRIVPNLSAQLAPGTSSLSLFFLVHPIAGSENQPALRMQILRDGRTLAEMPMKLDKVSGDGGAIPYLATIHGGAFSAGQYQVKAVLSQDGATVFRSISFSGSSAAGDSTKPSSLTVESTSTDEADSRLVSEAANAGSRFVIGSPTRPVPPPTDAAIQTIIGGARQRALGWSDSLVNFLCYEVTQHFVPTAGEDGWKLKDTLVERMSYIDHEETRTTFMLNGDRSAVHPDRLPFAHSAGEFGGMFYVIFNPSAKTVFTWKQYGLLDGQPVDVFAFKVARANSRFDLSDRDGHDLYVGFHGLLYLDPATESVRRISAAADDIPSKLLIRACSMSIDYSWISMQDHDFLLPVRGAVSLRETRRRPVLNEFAFHDYHRFGSQSRILTDGDFDAPKKN